MDEQKAPIKLRHVRAIRRSTSAGENAFHYYYRRASLDREIPLGSDIEVVRARHAQLEGLEAHRQKAVVRTLGTIGGLIEAYKASPEWLELADNTKSLWKISFRSLEDTFGSLPPAAIDRVVAIKTKTKMIKQHGPDGARNRIFAYRRLWAWGLDTGAIARIVGDDVYNPWTKPGSFGRNRRPTNKKPIWRVEDLSRFLKAKRTVNRGGNPKFKNSGKHEDVDLPNGLRMALLLGFFTLQRLSDILMLTGKNLIKMRRGEIRFRLRQGKTGVEVEAPLHSMVKAELRRQRIQPGSSEPLVRSVRERKFDRTRFKKQFAVWAKAAKSNLRFRDLRRSGMVALAERGSFVSDIAALSGHTISSTQTIIDTYIVKTAPMAQSAMKVFEGITIPDA